MKYYINNKNIINLISEEGIQSDMYLYGFKKMCTCGERGLAADKTVIKLQVSASLACLLLCLLKAQIWLI